MFDIFELRALAHLSKVAVVVSLHLVKETLGFEVAGSLRDEVVVDDLDEVLTDVSSLLDDLLLILVQLAGVFAVLRLMRDGLDRAVRVPAASDDMLVAN